MKPLWNFGLSWGWGPFRVGFYSGGFWHRHHRWHHRHSGRWGPGGYRPRPVHYGHNNFNRANVRNNNLYRDKAQRANVATTRDLRPGSQETRNRVSTADRAGTARPATRPDSGKIRASDLSRPTSVDRQARPSSAKNNVFTDKSGNVYRQTDKGWQKNDGKSWSNVPSTGSRDGSRPSTGAASTRPSTSNSAYRQSSANTRQSSAYKQSNSGYGSYSSLDRQSHSRQRTSTRSSQHRAQRSRGGGRRH